MVSLVVSLSKSASVSPALLSDGWTWVLLKLPLRWSAVSEDRVWAGNRYAATSTNPATRTVNEGRHGTRPATEVSALPICQAVRTKPTLHATNERALKPTVNRV